MYSPSQNIQQRSSQLQHIIQRLDDSEPATADPVQFVDSAFSRMLVRVHLSAFSF
jgi:hypothetical protein